MRKGKRRNVGRGEWRWTAVRDTARNKAPLVAVKRKVQS